MVALLLWLMATGIMFFVGPGFIARAAFSEWKGVKAFLGISLSYLLAFSGLFSPLFYEYPNPPFSVPVTMEGGQIKRYPFGVFAWEFGRGWTNMPLEVFRAVASSSVTPITDNPKARKISYEVAVELADPDAYYGKTGLVGQSADLPTGTTVGNIQNKTQYALFEFNEKHSQELARFYNPLDDGQQAAFAALVINELTPKLKDYGLRIVSARFRLD